MYPPLTLPNSPVYQSSDRTDYRQDWLDSGVDDGIINLNVEEIAGADLFEFLYPHPQRLNTGRLNAHYMRLWDKCVAPDWSPLSHGWICNGRVKILEGPILTPDEKGKVSKYRNPKDGNAPITFLKVPPHIWGKVSARWLGVTPSENTTREGEADYFWAWVQESRADVVLTEGEKKAGCLLTRGHAAIALPGISMGWRVTEKDARGRAIARELHPDLLPFDDGREITIAFDYRPGDWFESPEFKNAAILARLFKKSTVKIARLPGPQKGIDDFAIASGDVDLVLALAETVQQLQDERLWRSYKGFSPHKVVNQRYLDLEAPEEGKITAIKSGLGTGKTQYLADKVRPQAGKQLNIGYRNSLLLQMAQKLDSYHLDAHGGYQMMNDPEARLSLCWDSLQKVAGLTFEDATLILDEASSSIKHLLTSSNCRDIRLSLLDYLKAIAPSVNRVIALDGNLSDSVTDFLAEVFKMPVVKIENQFKGDTPPVTFLELPNSKQRLVKAEFEWLAWQILNSPCPAVATDSLRDAEALAKRLKDEGRYGLLLTSKTAVEEWAKEFLADPDEYIRRHKPEFLIYTPTAESGLDISIKDYFSDCFCWFVGVIGVDECLQMSRRVRHPERLIICCSQRKLKLKSEGDFPSLLIEVITEQVTAEAGLLSPESQAEAIAAQINSPEMKAWARITAKDNVESRNLQRFLFKSYVEAGFSVQRVALEGLKDVDEYHRAKVFCKETEAKEIFYAEDITLAEALEIERNFNAPWPDRCKALKAKLKARLPGIEDTELWTWEFVYRVRFTDRDLLNQLEADWLFKNTEDAEYLQRQKWKREFKTFLPDLSTRWLKLKVLSRLGIDKFLAPGVAWRNDSPEVEELVRQCRKKSVAALLGHPGKLSNIQYLNRLLKIIGAQLIGTQVRDGGDRFWEYRYQVGPEFKKSSRPENWEELYPLVCQKMTEKVQALKMSEFPAVIDSEVVTAPPLNIQNTAEAVTQNQTHPTQEKVWGVACEVAEVAREVAEVALWVARGMVESAKTCLHDILNRYGYLPVAEALESLSAEQRLAVESLG